ncbi:hemerythrin HHE cation-binding protein [Brasilonema octagenarum UFV-E1]|uniref:Hemerythrin HHE cation-binding protein n=3 Tax=Scytonemataceae TaxID=1182 RepID=A0A856MLS0_9CYAN|nr:hemerythrin HHE cation-binding protein [Brasilonema octagenarum UFV-OR1]QDL12363.1 hemerythrin HHE cation-binding protein [Brasilonema sennae CENA114]QDL18744.1 hemerythrin HHE cation-binding protein [Brasilonema octagenarum UFV-E1]
MADVTNIATKLADLKLIQNVLLESEQKLIAQTDDKTICERLEGMIKSDRENLGIIEAAISKYGNTSEPRDITQKHAEKVSQMMSGSELTLYDKYLQLELLKHQQTMTGLVLHKVAQSLNDELQDLMEPLNRVNFENRAHQEILKGVLYFVGTREIAGKEPDMGLWASVEQGVAALKGALGSALS